MTQFAVLASNEQTIYAALELSKNSWLLAIQVAGRDKPSLHPIKGGNAEGLMAKLDAARDRVAKLTGQTPPVVLKIITRLQAEISGATDTSAAIRPYSIAVAPDTSTYSLVIILSITTLLWTRKRRAENDR